MFSFPGPRVPGLGYMVIFRMLEDPAIDHVNHITSSGDLTKRTSIPFELLSVLGLFIKGP